MSFHLKVNFFSMLGAGLGFPSELRSSKVRLIVLLSNRMTSGIHAHRKGNEDFLDTGKPTLLCCIPSKVLIGIKILQYLRHVDVAKTSLWALSTSRGGEKH